MKRTNDLRAQGLEWLHASGTADLEERIRQWPTGWGDDLHVLVYGDFRAPPTHLAYPTLGIRLLPEPKKDTIIRGALMVLSAVVTVQEKSVMALVDAGRRLNLLLGLLTINNYANAAFGWWSYVTHGTGGGAIASLDTIDAEAIASTFLKLPPEVRRPIEAALFWIRQPRGLFMEAYRSDVLRVYAGYWNAFECLVEAVDKLQPAPALSKVDKQKRIDELLQNCSGRLSPSDIQDLYLTVVNPGLVGKASHALRVCLLPEFANKFEQECFRVMPKKQRLYDIRNAINHGDVDAEDPLELVRIASRTATLHTIVFAMLARLGLVRIATRA